MFQRKVVRNKFLSVIAHDLRSPFNNIIGFLELLIHHYDHFNDEEKKSYLKLIDQDANKTLRFLDNLFLWTRLQSGELNIYQEKFCIGNLIDKEIEKVQEQLSNKFIVIEKQYSPDCYIFTDIKFVSLILQILIDNAIKYSTINNKILISVQTNSQVEIIITDYGIGMSTEVRKSLFEPGKQIVITGTQNEKGNGFGLVLCKELVAKLGGKLLVKSALGAGSSIKFILPK